MQHKATVTLEIVWDDEQAEHPRFWDWTDLVGPMYDGEYVKVREWDDLSTDED
jgi:hypothetical protein